MLAAKPLPPKPAIPAVAAVAADPAATPADDAIRTTADGYPNINVPAKEPAGSLMSADERARIDRGARGAAQEGRTAGKGCRRDPSRQEGGEKKTDGKCPDGASAATDADCKASDQ